MKKAIVTGGSRGIGRGIVYALAEDGYDVAFSYATKKDEALLIQDDIKEKYGRECYIFNAKLDESGAAVKFFSEAIASLGEVSLLVNNAGATTMESLLKLTEENMEFLINLDFKSYILLAREAARNMVENGVRGSIISITSTRGERSYPGDGIYGGLKAGLNRAIGSFALDLAPHGIRINNIAPGAIRVRTKEELLKMMQEKEFNMPMPSGDFWDELGKDIPLGRAGLPEDIAQAVLFLASDRASYITGITLRVDGGLILPGMPEMVIPGTNRWGGEKVADFD